MEEKLGEKVSSKTAFIVLSVLLVVGVVVGVIVKNNAGSSASSQSSDSSVAYQASTNEEIENKIDALSYTMKLNLDSDTRSLREDVAMNIRNGTKQPVKEIVLRDMTPSLLTYFKENYDESAVVDSHIDSIKTDGGELAYTVEEDSIVKVQLKEALSPGATIAVQINMQTSIPERQDRFGYIKGHDGDMYALSFCFPYLADNKDGIWVTAPYFDDGENRSTDVADYDIELTHPEGYVVIATGDEKTSGNITHIQAKNVRDMAIVVSNMMDKDVVEAEGITVNNYYLNGTYTDEYRKLTSLVIKESIEKYTQKIGKYPYDSLDVVPLLLGFGYGGMEYPGLVMTNASSFYEGATLDAWSLKDGLSHEIGHQWFYATVGNDEYTQGWIDEGFTTFLEREIFGLYDGQARKYLVEIDDMTPSLVESQKSRDELLENARNDYKNLFLNVPPTEYPEGQEYGEAEYEASYVFVQELRLAMGDEKFYAFLKDFYQTYYLKVATTDDVLSLIKKHDNSEKVQEIIGFYFK
ncbi:MAG: M1 family metallopeptidase [Actinomycetaceae bacterium]|nr:M1 family metallopeptidase [Actinomycetaceae bacterium]